MAADLNNKSIIPSDDSEGINDSGAYGREIENHSIRKLDAEATAKENINKEADQRYNLRGWAVVVVSIMLLLLFFLINTIVKRLLLIEDWAEIPTIVIGIYAIPILSATVLAISLLIAAFRGYKDNDGPDAADIASKATRAASAAGT